MNECSPQSLLHLKLLGYSFQTELQALLVLGLENKQRPWHVLLNPTLHKFSSSIEVYFNLQQRGQNLNTFSSCLLFLFSCEVRPPWVSIVVPVWWTNVGFSFWCRNPMLRFGVLPSVDVACEECCRCMQRCWFPQTLPTRQSSRCMSTVLAPD